MVRRCWICEVVSDSHRFVPSAAIAPTLPRMSSPSRHPGKYTIADWLAQPEERRLELIDGELVEKAAPSYEHGRVQSGTLGTTVFRHQPDGYLVALRAEAHERVRAEPFDAIEVHVGVLLGDDPEDAGV